MPATMHSSNSATTSATTHAAKDYLPTLARLLMCSLFIWDGVLQLRDPAGTVNYFTSLNIPSPNITVWVSIAIHLLGGIGILIGFMTRWAAALLILLCLGTAFGVHLPAGDMENMTHFYKNLVMAGGFLYVIAFGPGAFALDREKLLDNRKHFVFRRCEERSDEAIQISGTNRTWIASLRSQ